MAQYELQRKRPGTAEGGTGDTEETWFGLAAAPEARLLVARAREIGAGEYRIVRLVQTFRVETRTETVAKVARLDAPTRRKRTEVQSA